MIWGKRVRLGFVMRGRGHEDEGFIKGLLGWISRASYFQPLDGSTWRESERGWVNRGWVGVLTVVKLRGAESE